MFHCTSNTCIRKNSGTYLFDEVTTDEQTTSKLVVQESIVDAILRMARGERPRVRMARGERPRM